MLCILRAGHMSSRLQTKEDCILLLDYLISELMAARMVNVDCPKEKTGSGMEIVVVGILINLYILNMK